MRNAALFSVAIAFFLVAIALFYIGMNMPELNRNLERLSVASDVVTEEFPGLLDTANRLEPHVSPLLDEVAASRLLVGQVVQEAAAYRSELPAMMSRVDAMESRLAAVQAQLPEVMTRLDALLEESKVWRPVTESALKESEAWRSSIPDYLIRSEQLVAGARQAGKEASAGMVGGLISGTLSLPFQALANVGVLIDRRSMSARFLTDEDQANLRNAAIHMLQNPEEGLASWSSVGSGHAGTVEVVESAIRDEGPCHTLRITNLFQQGKSDVMTRKICRNVEGKWALAK
ncbi:hypothetical protein [Alcanivorax sp. 1008]|uniref:hypothetical protein n=1 Tax=Alcanivorax sp. 1008 TaxID=2816853 RepID=UPI001D87CEF6|nr:hypothetical protein [Alcanivorax sp. 1008]MCC1495936.1 hypothetical protein [Alcanivorax sp. 1008]